MSVRRAKWPLLSSGVNPDGEELRAQIALSSRFQVEVAAVERIAEIEILIDEALRRVGVGIDDDGGLLHPFRGLIF